VQNLTRASIDFREFLLSKAKILGQLRHLNLIKRWNVLFKKLHQNKKKTPSFFDCAKFESEDECIQLVLSLKRSNQITFDQIKKELSGYSSNYGSPDLFQLCHGKDTMQITIYYLNRHLRGKRNEIIDVDHI
jgi:hypothetical protein